MYDSQYFFVKAWSESTIVVSCPLIGKLTKKVRWCAFSPVSWCARSFGTYHKGVLWYGDKYRRSRSEGTGWRHMPYTSIYRDTQRSLIYWPIIWANTPLYTWNFSWRRMIFWQEKIIYTIQVLFNSYLAFFMARFTLQRKKENQATRCSWDLRNFSTDHVLSHIFVRHVIILKILQNVRFVRRLSYVLNTVNWLKNSHKSSWNIYKSQHDVGIFFLITFKIFYTYLVTLFYALFWIICVILWIAILLILPSLVFSLD